MDPKARREVKVDEDLLDCPEYLVFLALREQTVQRDPKEVQDRWVSMG